MARFSVQVSRHYGGYKGVGGQIGMHSFSEHDSMAHARTAATQFARKHPKDEILIYDNQTKRLTTVRAMPKQNPAGGIRAQVRRLASGQIQLKIPLKRGENALRKAHEVAKALGRKVVSVARAGRQAHNPEGLHLWGFMASKQAAEETARYNNLYGKTRSGFFVPGSFRAEKISGRWAVVGDKAKK